MEVKLCFLDCDIIDLVIQMTQIPRIGESFIFPQNFIQYTNGAFVDHNEFKVLFVDWVLNESNQIVVHIGLDQ